MKGFGQSGKEVKVNKYLLWLWYQAICPVGRMPLGTSRQAPAKCPVQSFGYGHVLRAGTVAPWALFLLYQGEGHIWGTQKMPAAF